MDLSKFKREDVTHVLHCRHCVSARNCMEYNMDCIVLKEMPNRRLKIVVFGDRYWKDRPDNPRIRYVYDFNVSEKQLSEKENGK